MGIFLNTCLFQISVANFKEKIKKTYGNILFNCDISTSLKGTLMQIWKSANIFVFTWTKNVEDFTLKHILRFEICPRVIYVKSLCLQTFRNNLYKKWFRNGSYLANIYLFKVSNRNSRKRCEVCYNLIKTMLTSVTCFLGYVTVHGLSMKYSWKSYATSTLKWKVYESKWLTSNIIKKR